MATSSIIVADAIERLDMLYLNDRNGELWNPTAKYWALNEAIEDLTLLVADYAPTILMEQYTVPFVAGTVEYALPTDFLRPYRVTANIPGVTIPPNYILPNIDYSEDGQVFTGWYIRDDNIGIRIFQPLVGTIVLDYIKRPAIITDITQPFPFFNEWASLVIMGAAIQLKLARGLDVDGLVGMYDRKVARIQSSYANRAKDVTTRGVISTGDNGWG
jgi:hypothetical protein